MRAEYPEYEIVFEKRDELFGVLDALIAAQLNDEKEHDRLLHVRFNVEKAVNALLPPIRGTLHVQFDDSGIKRG